jgi:hypothetical protein
VVNMDPCRVDEAKLSRGSTDRIERKREKKERGYVILYVGIY